MLKGQRRDCSRRSLPKPRCCAKKCATPLNELSDREREVVGLRYGLGGGKAHTLQELGAHFKVSRERVRQIEGQALRKLRKGGLAQAVRHNP
jgi:DNA-directed RNA polymerase sigma subunit (sigma70/sigma32)